MDVVVFGDDPLVTNWLEVLSEIDQIGSLHYVSQSTEFADVAVENGASYLPFDVFASSKYTPVEQAQYRSLANCDMWVSMVDSQKQSSLLRIAESCNVNHMILQAPFTDWETTPALNNNDVHTKAYVTYTETIHPVFKSIIQNARENSITVEKAFHWRGFDDRENVGINARYTQSHPAVQHLLTHDISQLHLGRQLLQNSGDISLRLVNEVKQWADVEYKNTHPFEHIDGEAWVNLQFETPSNGNVYTIQGGFTDTTEQSHFLWIDETKSIAYYGNTTANEYRTPSAYKITGEQEISILLNNIVSGNVTTDTEETQIMDDVASEKLLKNPTVNINKRFVNRILSRNPVPTIQDALEIEQIAQQFYNRSQDSQTTEIREATR